MAGGKDYLLGVDLGAGSLKASIIDPDGHLVGTAASDIGTATPRFGWSEQNPEDWYRAFCAAVPAALAAAGIEAGQLAAAGLSAGAHIGVLLDGDDRVIRPALLWNDQRSASESEELHARAGDLIVRRSLNRVNPTWTLAQLLWLRRHEPEAVARVRKLCIAKDYLRSRITGAWATDFSDVVGALMADAETGGWSAELCGLIDWPMDTLPPVRPATASGGVVTAVAARDSGLIAGLPVVIGSNDTTVESFGVGAIEPGQGVIKLATAGVLYLITEGPRVKPPISCYPHILPGLFYAATGTNACASSHRWIRDQIFAPLDRPNEDPPRDLFATMDEMARDVPPGAEGLLFHPYLQGERAPYWDPCLRADFIGLTMRHDRRHFARAAYEGIAFSIRDLLAAAKSEGFGFGEIRLIGGGSRSSLWRQIISDVTGLEVLQPENGDASFGAALLAGVGAGLFSSPEDAVARCARIVDRTKPGAARAALYDRLFEIYKDAQSALAPLDHRLHQFTMDTA